LPELSESPKAHLGRYELVARIATGGMGEIFLARLEGAAGFEKLYVIKRVLPHLAGDTRFRTMLIDEARIASKLSHPNVCQVYELGETDGELYIVMEYLEGVTLLPLLRHASQQGRPLELGMVACIVQQITDALHYAHELRDRDGTILNIVHRDVTPSNIFITESGVAKVLDFGIAKAKNVSTNTQTGTVKGKHAYMAPEQLRGAPLDRRVDVFAVGVLLFEMLALRRLFQRRTDYLTLQAVMEQPIPDVRSFRPDLPGPLVAALGRALQRDRDERFETVRQLGAAVVDAIAAGQRVWTPSDLGDQMGIRFADEIRRRGAAVLAAVARPAEASRRYGLPHLSEFSADGDSDLDDLDLPTIDSEAYAAPPTRVERPEGLTPGAAFAGLPALSSTTDEPTVARRPRRLWIWPALALAILGVGGAVLFSLWHGREREPTLLVISDERSAAGASPPEVVVPDPSAASAPDEDASAGASGADAAGSGSDSGSGGAGDPSGHAGSGHAPRKPRDLVRAKIAALRPQMERCLNDHKDDASGDVRVTALVKIDVRGVVVAVEIQPAAIAATPLAACIAAGFRALRFPEQGEPLEITVPFSTKLRL
jgi:eukaryotic-like serine/threonine-protein kinase